MLKKAQQSQNGLTLVELLVVIAIIGVLSMIGLTSYTNVRIAARNAKRVADVQAIGKAYEINFSEKTGYQTLTNADFAGATPPAPPEGGTYNFVSGPGTGSTCNQVKICTALEPSTASCSDTSTTCYCYVGQYSIDGCTLASLPTPTTPPGPPSSTSIPFIPTPTPAAPGPTTVPTAIPTTAPVISNRVFVTSIVRDGNFGGISGADSMCNTLATNAGLGGSWKAWLSSDISYPGNHFTNTPSYRNKAFTLLNGTTIANNWTELTSGKLLAPISITEIGTTYLSFVWTNTDANGTAFSSLESCNNWTTNSDTYVGRAGNSGQSDSMWSSKEAFNCDHNTKAIYCFEQ